MLAALNMGGFKIINGAAPVAATDVAIKSYVDATIAPGLVMGYAINAAAPAGWLYCNGASISTTTYANLFAVVGYSYGGSGASFSLPDYRGTFLRGYDNGRGLDHGGTRTPNAFQQTAIINHFHTVSDPGHSHGLPQSPHTHGDFGHGHGVNDPTHAHSVPSAGLGSGVNLQPGGGFNLNTTLGTTASATGISIQTGFANLAAANANISINGAFTGIAVSSVSTGTVSTETVPYNYPVLWCIKY